MNYAKEKSAYIVDDWKGKKHTIFRCCKKNNIYGFGS
jgi:hypothetical protein